jgi:hypothetical protein
MANGAMHSPDIRRDTITIPAVFVICISFGESGG